MIRKIIGIYFSPVGGTARMTEMLTEGLASRLQECAPDGVTTESYDLRGTEDDRLVLDEETIAVICMPVYVGKIPLPAITALDKVKASGAKTVVAVSYGGRTFGNALYELQHCAEENDFKVIGAGAFAVRRPRRRRGHGNYAMQDNSVDTKSLGEFCKAASGKIRRLSGCEVEGLRIEPAPVEVSGRLPIHRISKLSPKAAAMAQGMLERISLIHRESEWYL